MAQTQETVVLHGHIIDSLILAKVLDTILMMGGTFDLTDVKIGATGPVLPCQRRCPGGHRDGLNLGARLVPLRHHFISAA